MRNELQRPPSPAPHLLPLRGQPSQKGAPGDPRPNEKTEGRLGLIDDNRASGTLVGRGGRRQGREEDPGWNRGDRGGRGEGGGPPRVRGGKKREPRMDTSSRTKSVERPVRAVDLFIASLDALTLLRGSSTLSARIDSDERAASLASFGRPVCGASDEGERVASAGENPRKGARGSRGREGKTSR